MQGDDSRDRSPFEERASGGRILLGGLLAAAVVLLLLLPWQTVPGSAGQTAMSGGWWAEPALAPAIALALTIVAAAVAFLAAPRDAVDARKAFRDYGRVALVSGCMLGAVTLMTALGFALSILAFASVAAFVAGFRGARLGLIALGTTVAMVLVFRVGFSIWFPRPLLFRWIDLPVALQGLL